MERRRLSQTMASEWQTAFVVSHKMQWCASVPCSLPSKITTKVLKNCKTFSSRPRPRPNVQDQDHDFMIQDHRRQPRRGCRGRISTNILVGGDINGNVPTNIRSGNVVEYELLIASVKRKQR